MYALFLQLAVGFFRSRRAVTALEYGLIAALIAVVIIGSVTSIGTGLVTKFTAVANQL
jgi:pilus assembly protein Flp/PilA